MAQSATKSLITISIPILDEEENILPLLDRLRRIAKKEMEYDFEFLFTDNASSDNSFELLKAQALKDSRIRVLRFLRNFGFQKSILTNYNNARGDAAIQIDADMQDPPELISDFLRLWEKGYKVVYGVRKNRRENICLRYCRHLFYRIVNRVSDYPVPESAGDFRLIDRKVLEELRCMKEQTPYLRGMISGMGYPQIGVEYDRDIRERGKSKFGFFKLVDLSFDAITAQSIKPLRIASFFGLAVLILSLVGMFFYLGYSLLSSGSRPSGFVTIVLLQLSLIGLNAVLLGLLGEYIGRIFNNTRGLPLTVITDRIENKKQKG